MAKRNLLRSLTLGAVLLPLLVGAQEQATPSTHQIRVRTGEVVVDLSVTSSDGKPVRGLTAADFEVYEDGIRQKIESFRYVSSGARRQVAATPEAAPKPAAPVKVAEDNPVPASPHLISLVFDKVGTDRSGAMVAASAARQYVEKVLGKDDLAAVFGIGLGVQVYRSFTGDRESLSKAISEAVSGNTKLPGNLSDEIRHVMDTIPGSSDEAKIALAYSDVARGPDLNAKPGAIQSDLQLNLLRMLLIFQSIDRETRTDKDLAGLLSIIEAQRIMPGRKYMIYFCGGFTMPPSQVARFRAVVGAANRAGVTIYSVDTAGLRGQDPNEESRTEEEAYHRNRNIQTAVGGGKQWVPVVTGGSSPMERLEEAQGLNLLENLEELSQETGGYTVRNTNDFLNGLQSIGQDMEEYYVLTYVPSKLTADGKFRTISVKPRQSNLKVRARRGYYAFPEGDPLPLLSFEAELLESLNAKIPVSDFPLSVGGYSFPETDGTSTSALCVQFPLSRLKTEKRGSDKSYQGQADVMLLVKNSEGSVVQRLSRQYELEGSQDKLEATRQKDFLFYRMIPLEPGDYFLQAAVRDRVTGKTSVKAVEFHVAPGDWNGVSIGSVVMAKDSVLSADRDDVWDAFRVEDAKVLPDLSGIYRKAVDRDVIVYFTATGAEPASKTRLEFLRDGKPDFTLSETMGSPDLTGRTRFVTRVPLVRFKPGQYELRVTIGNSSASATFRVE